jgi:hypothetical protein
MSMTAAVALKVADSKARDRLRLLEAHGLARRTDDGNAPHRWLLIPGPTQARPGRL